MATWIRFFARAIFRRSRLESEMAEELRFHIESRTQDLMRSGVDAAEAARRARLEFGAFEHYREECRQARGIRLLDEWRADLRYAARMLRKSPGFTFVAVLSLALGIGANSMVFSVLNALVLRPLPVQNPGHLVFLQTPNGHAGQSFPNYKDLRDRNTTMIGLSGYRISPMSLEAGSGANRVWGYLATGNYFDMLGVTPLLGRFFHQQDDLRPGASSFAVLSYECWQRRFAGDPDIVGKTVRINRLPYTVLGVAPHEFQGTELFYRPEVWAPMMMQAQIEPGNPWLNERATLNTWMIGRLKPGVSTAQAEANLNAIAADLARQYPWPNEGLKFKLARPGLVGDAIRGPVKAFTAGVLALAGLVLLAACANLASLLTARTADRRREIAIRLSIGAGRGRIVRQLLTESLLLSMAGGLAGYALAIFLSNALSAWRAPMDFPVQFDVNADWRVFFFAFAVSTMAGVLFGLAPARHVSRTDMNAVLKGADGGLVGGRRFAFRDILVALQVALCFVLVSGCLLSLRGLQRALTMPLGFQPRGVAVAAFELGLAGYSKPDGESFQRRALDAVKQLPGVRSAAYSNSLPLSIDQSHNSIYPEDQPNRKPLNSRSAVFYQVSPDFFRTMQIRLVAGRDFNWRDDPHSPFVAIVNQAFARKILYSDKPIGKRFRFGPGGPLVEVIGVVNDGKYESLTESPQPVVFKPILQSYNSTTTLLVRSELAEGQMVAQMRRAVAQLDPGLPLYGTGSLQQMLGFAFFPSQAAAVALSAFGVLAIVLAATGINGLVAYAVSRRVREIGIRMAIGARPSEVLRLVLARMAALLMAGAMLGLVLAIAAGQVLASVIYQASPRDPLALAAVALTIIGIGILSCWAPARRALRIDPMVALRYE